MFKIFNFFKRTKGNKENKKNKKKIKVNFGKITFKQSFFAGLFTLIPIVSTIYLIIWLFRLTDDFLGNFVRKHFVHYNIPGVGLISIILIIMITGYLLHVKWIHKMYTKMEEILSKIPLVDKIYFVIKQVVNAFTNENNRAFKSVVLVEYPNIGMYSLGLETVYKNSEMDQKTDCDLVSVFIPTTPNPTAGNVMFVPKDKVVYLDLKIETALKIMVSGGIVKHED